MQGRYRIERELGKGGFGAVYCAWDSNVDRRCAVKENLEMAAEGRRQFSREATVLANLSHPNLPRVTDHFSIPGQGQYLVMDFVEGDDLGSLVNRQGKIPVEQALSWMIQVADALVYIHSQQPPVLHRDIKPANIRITPGGQAMLVDFGLVKVFDPNLKTTMGARAVTPGYAPPEQYGQGRTDHRTDIYALGATLYTLLTGQEPPESVQRVAGGQMPSAQAAESQCVHRNWAEWWSAPWRWNPPGVTRAPVEFKAALQGCQAEAECSDDGGTGLAAAAGADHANRRAGAAAARSPDRCRKARENERSPGSGSVWGRLYLLGFAGMAMLGGLYLLGSVSSTATPASQDGTTPGAFLAGETPPGPTSTPAAYSKDPNTYTFLASDEPDTLDVALGYSQVNVRVIFNVYESLIFYERDNPNSFVPQLALEVPSAENGGISIDGRMYRFKIRPGVKFHNGRPANR